MGIPKFNRFITNRYPGVQEELKDGSVIEFDNFFVDMNGIIHLCSHPEEGISDKNYTDKNIYENIFNFVDVLFEIVKPKKLLFLAIDGVAPRAKLNQQRGRRFRNAKEREFWETQPSNIEPPPFSRFDTNCITPGTNFMERLQKYLEYYITYRISTSPSWKNIRVILCGSKVAGEGEHKIMEHIRSMRNEPDYSLYDRHCLYGLDADLIILGLCTHEKNISILRERTSSSGKAIRVVRPKRENFSLIHLSLLKEYLEIEFQEVKSRLRFTYNLHRIIDDWVLLGFLVGNDYIPHIADFHIERGAIQMLYRTYIEVLPTLNGAKNHPYFDDKKDLVSQNDLNFGQLFAEYQKDYYRTKLKFGRNNLSKKCGNLAKEYVRGLQWILLYYYHGCKSWSWFYPEHYGPCASSFMNIENTNVDFTLEKPFLPYEQLLAVLPPASKTLLPQCYQTLMTANDSPIRKYYPTQFETDLNGKRNEWEAVVLLPMIDQDELLSAMKPLNDKLTPKENQNNTHSEMLIYSYTKELQASISPPNYFPVFSQNHASVTSAKLGDHPWQTVRIVYHSTLYHLQPDTYFPGFPTFRHINHRGEKIFWEVGLPDTTIRIERIGVNIKRMNKQWNSERAINLLGKRVYVNWPKLSEARIVAIEDESNNYSVKDGAPKISALEREARYKLTRTCFSLRNQYLERGLEIGNTSVIVYVNCLKGIRRRVNSSGVFSIEQSWSKTIDLFPLQTIVENLVVYKSHYNEHVTVVQMFPPETEVFSLEYSTYGYRGQITVRGNNSKDDRLPVKLEIVNDRRLNKEVRKYREPRYYSPSAVGKKLGISPTLVGIIAGSIQIKFTPKASITTQQSALNIGLQIKNSESNEKVPGYTKKEENWMYSSKAVALMHQYIEKFPEVIDFLSARSTWETHFTQSDLIPGFNDFEHLKRIAKWVQDLECSQIERVTCDSEIVEEDFIERLKQNFASISSEVKSHKSVFIKPERLFTNNLIIGDVVPVTTSNCKLFDRIVCTKRTGIIPYGARGYIVGIIRNGNGNEMYDILFDRSSIESVNLSSPIIKKVRISQEHFINITRGKTDSALTKGVLNIYFLIAYGQIIQSKVSGICSRLAKKLRIDDWILLLLVDLNKSKKEALPTVSNSSLEQVQENFWASYCSGLYNPFLLPPPSAQLSVQYKGKNRYFYLYMLRSIKKNDSNTQNSNQDHTRTNKLFGGRIFSVFHNLFAVPRQSFRSGAPADPDGNPSLQDCQNVMADNDQPGTSQVVATAATNIMRVQVLFRNFKQFILRPLGREQGQKDGQSSMDVVHPPVSATESCQVIISGSIILHIRLK